MDRPAVSRIDVQDPVARRTHYDYADAFAVGLPAPDSTPPATWLGTGLSQVPPVVDWVAARLGFSSMTPSDPLDGWDVRSSSPDLVHLVVDLPLLHVDFIGRNAGPARRMLTTLVSFRRPLLARLVWLVVGPAHRRTVRWVLGEGLRTVPVDV